MLYIYICEDEEVQLNYIRDMIMEYIAERGVDARIAAARQDPEEIMEELHAHYQPAVFFIDVQLDRCNMDGFDLARRLKWLNRCMMTCQRMKTAFQVISHNINIIQIFHQLRKLHTIYIV